MTKHFVPRKIDDILDKLEKAHGLTEHGREWLIAAADPFHDFDVPLSGYPDVSTDASIVQVVKKQFVIKKPADTAAGNWDCRVDLTPLLNPSDYGSGNTVGFSDNVITGATAINLTAMGGVVANANVASGPITFGTCDIAGSTNCAEFTRDSCRVIGYAMEITNTTADIYKQGSVTVYRMPSVITDRQVTSTSNLVTGTGTYYKHMQLSDLPMPPTTVQDCNLLYGSRTWDAADGAYVVSRLNGTDNPFKFSSSKPSTYSYAYYPTDGGAPFRTVYSASALSTSRSGASNFPIPYDYSGAYFTGLSEQTTLNVTVRWIIERQPISNPDLIVLVTPSPGYDPLALEIYTRAMQDLPPGVMLSENPLGEWFAKVLRGVSDWAPKIGSALNTVVPGAGLLGSAIGTGARLITPKKKEEKKETPAPVRQTILPASTTVVKPRRRLRYNNYKKK